MALQPGVRFARLFQVDPAHPGTATQRQALNDALNYQPGSDYDFLNWRLARAVKKIRPYILIGFHPNMLAPGLASPAGINFNDHIDQSGIAWFAPHENGHLVEHYLLTEADKQWFQTAVGRTDWGMQTQETFADACRDWRYGTAWKTLDPILLRVEAPSIPLPPPLAEVSPKEWMAAVDYDQKRWTPFTPDKIVVHYEGSTGLGNSDVAAEQARLRAHEKYHIEVKGWLGLAYNGAIGNSGTYYRIRGENRSGATSGDAEPDGIPENHEAFAILFLVGGSQIPSPAALETFHQVWEGRGMPPVTVHKDSTSTACPGDFLTGWVRSKGYQ